MPSPEPTVSIYTHTGKRYFTEGALAGCVVVGGAPVVKPSPEGTEIGRGWFAVSFKPSEIHQA